MDIFSDIFQEPHDRQKLANAIFQANASSFEDLALRIFRFQYEGVPVYRQFCEAFHRHPNHVSRIEEIPYLPIRFFKSHDVIHQQFAATKVFESSVTGGGLPSRHGVADLALYEQSFQLGLERTYGNMQQYDVLALLPSYLERGTSSLLYMADWMIKASSSPLSGFFKDDFSSLQQAIECSKRGNRKLFLLGVTYALLDFAAAYPQPLPDAIIMETGGMKGRRREMTRSEVHQILSASFQVNQIHSEYGMTELLSQLYAVHNGRFQEPPWVKVLTRELLDPLQLQKAPATGALNVIDLANFYSCSFLATDDLARINGDGTIEIIGRIDQSEVRGCNLLYAN
ncbi:MAG: acyl transferase [Chitinophagales bacterium]